VLINYGTKGVELFSAIFSPHQRAFIHHSVILSSTNWLVASRSKSSTVTRHRKTGHRWLAERSRRPAFIVYELFIRPTLLGAWYWRKLTMVWTLRHIMTWSFVILFWPQRIFNLYAASSTWGHLETFGGFLKRIPIRLYSDFICEYDI